MLVLKVLAAAVWKSVSSRVSHICQAGSYFKIADEAHSSRLFLRPHQAPFTSKQRPHRSFSLHFHGMGVDGREGCKTYH